MDLFQQPVNVLSSIRLKIILFYLAILMLLLTALGIFLSLSLRQVVHNAIDSELRSKAEDLALLISSDRDKTRTDLFKEMIGEYNLPKSKSYFQIRRLDGSTLEKSVSLKNEQLPVPKNPLNTGFQTVHINQSPIRIINFHVPKEPTLIYKGEPVDQLTIQCAQDISDRLELIDKFNYILLFSIIFILLISTFGGFFIAHKALIPLKEISKTIDRISESNLAERINLENIPVELNDLAVSFNHTFSRLEQSFNRQRQFAADASHELRTPLSVIISQCEVTLRRERTSDDYQQTLKDIDQAATLMTEIIKKLFTLARLGTDKEVLNIETVPLEEIVRESVKLMSSRLAQKEVLINNFFNDQVFLLGDRALLTELFTNLIDNAIKYNVPKGEITISTRRELPWIVCEIKDSGIGIPEKELEKIFDRFYRIDKSRSKKVEGIGLGLSICDEIVKRHNGKIEIKSRIGEGTVVSVYFILDVEKFRRLQIRGVQGEAV